MRGRRIASRIVYKIVVIALVWVISRIVVAAPLIPDFAQHQAFLYNEWRPNRSNVVVFIDPLCPYCKRAIPKFERIHDYNLFVYWAPIFGERSEKIIKPFFRCDKPTSKAILNQFSKKSASSFNIKTCEERVNSDLRELNDRVVESYPINGVPAYFLQGVRVSLSQLVSNRSDSAKRVNGVAIDWKRYASAKVTSQYYYQNQAIIVPNGVQDLESLITRYQPAYLFSADNWSQLCQSIKSVKVEACSALQHEAPLQKKYYLELLELLGLSDKDKLYLVLNDGRVKIQPM